MIYISLEDDAPPQRLDYVIRSLAKNVADHEKVIFCLEERVAELKRMIYKEKHHG